MSLPLPDLSPSLKALIVGLLVVGRLAFAAANYLVQAWKRRQQEAKKTASKELYTEDYVSHETSSSVTTDEGSATDYLRHYRSHETFSSVTTEGSTAEYLRHETLVQMLVNDRLSGAEYTLSKPDTQIFPHKIFTIRHRLCETRRRNQRGGGSLINITMPSVCSRVFISPQAALHRASVVEKWQRVKRRQKK